MHMVERVARAIALDRAEPFDDMEADEQASWIETARAAIAAMREPTIQMRRAASKSMSPDNKPEEWVPNGEKHAIRYRAMIDAALNTEKPPATPKGSER
jgi:hypothetical protein